MASAHVEHGGLRAIGRKALSVARTALQTLLRKLGKALRLVVVPLWRDALLHHRVAAAVEHIDVLRNMGSVSSVVDIGANRGQFALVARHCFPEAVVTSFEPLPGPAAALAAVFSEGRPVAVIEAAIGPKLGQATIHISKRDDSSSLLPITVKQHALFPGTEQAFESKVRVGRLSDFLGAEALVPPALLKIDVQGYELQVLQGCEDVLDRFLWIYVECSFVELYAGQALADEVTNWLHVRGFRLQGVHQVQYDDAGHTIQADFLFLRLEGAGQSSQR